MQNAIQVSALKKSYGDHIAVNDISFDVGQGELFAFLGTNGAGKSTTINILTGLIQKTSGEVLINGFRLGRDDARIKKLTGVVYQNSTLDDFLTVQENMEIRGSLYGIPRDTLKQSIREVADITGCVSFMNRRYGKLSGGQRRRADISCALLHHPQILFLDEPTTGLDPSTRASIWQTISDMQATIGTTVFLTTHYMEEAAKADDVVMIHKGSIVAHDTPARLKEKYTVDHIRISEPSEALIHRLTADGIPYTLEKQVLRIQFSEASEAIDLLSAYKGDIRSFEVVQGSMDEVFMGIANAGNV